MPALRPRPARVLAALLVAAGCAEESPPAPLEQVVALEARSDDGTPLAGASLEVAGTLVGSTDARGAVTAQVRAPAGTTVEAVGRCPTQDHRPREERRRITLSAARALGAATSASFGFRLICEPSTRRAAVVVKARPDLPVLLMGREVARTDRDGVAHVLLRLQPHSSFRLTLDTRTQARLRPVDPSRSFALADRDEVFLFEQPLEETPLPRRRPRPPPPRPPRPTAIVGHKGK